jgi:hypothetical protein
LAYRADQSRHSEPNKNGEDGKVNFSTDGKIGCCVEARSSRAEGTGMTLEVIVTVRFVVVVIAMEANLLAIRKQLTTLSIDTLRMRDTLIALDERLAKMEHDGRRL